ncbi:MAG: ABC transporter ATP-binding protein [Chitinophagales bacterium]
MKSLIELWKFIKPYRSRIWLNMMFNLMSSIFAIFSLLMLIPFLKLLFDKTNRDVALPEGFSLWGNFSNLRENGEIWLNYKLSELINTQGELKALMIVCVAVVIVFFLKNLFRYLALYVVAAIKRGVVRDLHGDFYNKILQFPMAYFNKNKKGDLLSRFTNDVLEVDYGILYFLESFLKDPIMIILTLLTMFAIDVQLTLWVLIALPISGLVIGVIGKKLKHESKITQQIFSRLLARLEETISGVRVIKSFTAQDYLAEQFNKENQEHYVWSKKMLRKRDLSSPMSEFLGILVVVIILWLGGRMVFNGQIQPETFIAYIVIFSQIIAPSKAFSNAYYYIQKGLASLERIQEVVNSPTESVNQFNHQNISTFKSEITFDHVSFSYQDVPVLNDVNFTIEKGDRVALIGESGAGKSTIVDLLLNLYDLNNGAIKIDGQPLVNIDKKSWRALVALVPQTTVLFNDTLKENILFGNNKANDEAVKQAATIARVDSFIGELQNGYETIIGDNGSKLSGGQRQRVAIARAFLKDAPILILDEATSALDATNENIIAETLRAMPEDKTVIIIAHRSTTIDECNKVIELENGKVKSIIVKEVKHV